MRRLVVTALAGIIAAGLLLPASPAQADPSPCPGAVVPIGFAITDGVPHLLDPPYLPASRYNPQSISAFIRASLTSANTAEGQTCLAVFGGDALLAGSTTVTVPGGGTARVFPYRFDFTPNPSLPTLRAGWVSGIAQGSLLGTLEGLYQRTSDQRWRDAAAETFASTAIPYGAAGGYVSRQDGLTYFQEYPTTPPSYVLNGHQEAVLGTDAWSTATANADGAALALAGAESSASELSLYDVPTPMGLATSYDLVRGRPAAPLRFLATGSLSVRSTVVYGGPGGSTVALRAPVVAAVRTSPTMLSGGSMQAWSGGLPAGWRLIPATGGGGLSRSGVPANWAARLVATVRSPQRSAQLYQDVPAARVWPRTGYRLAAAVRLTPPPGAPGGSGRIDLIARCPSGAKLLRSVGEVRGAQRSLIDVRVTSSYAGCGLRIVFRLDHPERTGTTLDVDDVTLTPEDAPEPSVTPTYDVQILRSPQVSMVVRYVGTGRMQAWSEGRWITIAALPTSSDGRVRVVLPRRFEGRAINLRYHELHVYQMWELYVRYGNPAFAAAFTRWLPMAPAINGLTLPTSPAIARRLGATPSGSLPSPPVPLDATPGWGPVPTDDWNG